MDDYRNLIVHATNLVLANDLISTAPGTETKDGHIICELLSFSTAICWHDAGFDEIRISVWWKYNHDRHPQKQDESFNLTIPLAKRKFYPNFVGVTASAWMERRNGPHIQGVGRNNIFDIYTRQGERSSLKSQPRAIANGFKSEGKFYM